MDIDYKVPEDLTNLCRTCMAVPENDQPFDNEIFQDNNSTHVYDLIKDFLNIEINYLDRLPKCICDDCYNYLVIFQSFKRKCDTADKTLKNLADVYLKNVAETYFIVNTVASDEEDSNHIKVEIETEPLESLYVDKEEFEEEIEIYVLPEEDSKNHNFKPASVKIETCDIKEKNLQCSFCSKVFQNYLQLCLHFLNHTLTLEGNHKFLQYTFCDYCGEVFNEENSVLQHINNTHKFKKDHLLQCTGCQDYFKSDMLLMQHEYNCSSYKNAVRHTNQQYDCPICKTSLDTIQQLKEHSLNHILSKIKCKHCDKKFATEIAWNIHLELYHGEYKFKCNHCNKVFTATRSLNNHIKRVHADKNSYICSICGKSFKSQTYLYTHKAIHEEKKKFICSYCGYSTNKVGDLQTHSRIHTSERPYECDYENCGKLFKTASQRISHMRIHLKIKSFKCTICSKVFSAGSTLKYHMMIHTGEKPYSCTECNVNFRRKHHLKAHLSKHNK